MFVGHTEDVPSCVSVYGGMQCKLFRVVMEFGLGLLIPLLLDLNCGSDCLAPASSCVLPSLHVSPPTSSVFNVFTAVSSLPSFVFLVLWFSSLSVLCTSICCGQKFVDFNHSIICIVLSETCEMTAPVLHVHIKTLDRINGS